MNSDSSGNSRNAMLLGLVAETQRELHRGRRMPPPRLDSVLDRDLGFDSLGRVELLSRVELAFAVRLPPSTLQTALTPRDLLAAIEAAAPSGAPGVDRSVIAPAAIADDGEPEGAATLTEALVWHVERHPERTQIIVVDENGGEERITYAELQRAAEIVAGGLQAEGLLPGQTVAIMLPTSPGYFHAYFGILLAGGVPVPIYPPARLSQLEEHVRRHTGILANAEAALLITISEAMPVARLLEANVPVLSRVLTVRELLAADKPRQAPRIRGEDIAFIQYTSGSTGDPKGVVLSHANLLANIRAIGTALEVGPQDVTVSWLPLYHDMGLIAAWLFSLYYGIPFVVMSPLTFLARPEEWLGAIHRYRGTLTAAPNFAFELCCKRVDEQRLAGLDLSSLRFCANGAEPVSPDTLERFCQRFAAQGFHSSAMAPVYGLAEASVGLAIPPPGRGPRIDAIEREPFARRGQAIPAAAGSTGFLRFVGCGRPLPGHEIRIVDDTGQEVGDRVQGNLQFRGPSATRGYYRRPEATARLIRDGWLDSGDRAYIADGEVFITGRVKDIIIRGGRNIYPHEIETTVGRIKGIRNGCVVAFGSADSEGGTERLIVLAETALTGDDAREALREQVGRAVTGVLGEPPDEVVLAPLHAVLKTSSGKLRRAACREQWERGDIGRATRAPWLQILRLKMTSLRPQLRRWTHFAGEYAYAVRVWGLIVLLAPLVWAGVVFAGNPESGWRRAGRVARRFFRLAGIPLSVRLPEPGLPAAASVLVANHASYLDGLVLAAALPPGWRFVAKRELQTHWLSRKFLGGLGTYFVERFVTDDSAADAERLIGEVRAGQSLAYFPEGTFRRMPGLLPFRLGAFVAAVQAGVPVLPVAIAGTRSILRGDAFFPRRGAVSVVFGEALPPPESGRGGGNDAFGRAVRLRDAARDFILLHCGEPSET